MRVRKEIILNVVLISTIFVLTFVYFYKGIISNRILIYGDYRYALTVWQHIRYHLDNVYIHAPKIPFFTILFLLSIFFGDVLAEKIFAVFILLISAVLVYFSNKYFLKKIFNESPWKILISAFIGTLIFLYNPWTINKIYHHYWLVLSLASSYALLLEIDKSISGNSSNRSVYLKILIISGLVVTSATQVQSLFIFFLPLVISYLMLYMCLFGFRASIKKIGCYKWLVLLPILLNLFWIAVYVGALFSGITKPSNYAMVYENVEQLSRRATILRVFQAASGWIWGGVSTPNFDLKIFNVNIWNLFSIIPLILGISALPMTNRETKTRVQKFYISYFSLLFIFSVLLSAARTAVVGIAYKWITINTPFGWVFRDPYKNLGLMIITLSLLYSVLAVYILKKCGKYKILPFILILFLTFTPLIWGWPALTGHLNGHLAPYLVKYPKDLEETIKYLKTYSDYRHNILWYPPKIESVYFIYRDVPQLSTSSLNVITLANEELTKYIEDNLKKSDRTNVLTLLKKLGVKYLILRHDLNENNQKKRLLSDIQSLQNLFEGYKKANFRNFTIYEIKNPNQVIEAHSSFAYGISSRLNKNCMFNNSVQYACFEDLLSPFDDYLIRVKSKHYNPGRRWSVGTFAGGWLKNFVPYLEKFGLENWQSDYNKGLVFTWAKDTALKIPFNVKKTDTHKLFIRYFKNQKGRSLKIKIDNRIITLNTKNQLNKFVWQDLGIFKLKKGRHKIILENIDGFNAINLFALIPEEEYNKAKQGVERLLQNKTIIYLFEAESDLYRGNIKVPDVIFENGCLLGTPKIVNNPDLSNGEALEFNADGKAWQSVDIIKEGYYRIGARLKGKFEIKIGDYIFDIHSPGLDLKYTPPFYLRKGKYYLQILPKGYKPILDTVYLYSVSDKNSEATLEDIFKIKDFPAKVKNYKKINPTLWKVKVNAKRPFMLSFAEAYDPLWEARIYKNGKKIEKVKSIPLYSVINGFWIDQTGDLEIVIRYKPQDWFEIGLVISALTFIGCMGYLFYDWRKNKKIGGQ